MVLPGQQPPGLLCLYRPNFRQSALRCYTDGSSTDIGSGGTDGVQMDLPCSTGVAHTALQMSSTDAASVGTDGFGGLDGIQMDLPFCGFFLSKLLGLRPRV
eukprot:2688820-Rhodomonas_salina.1